MTKPILRRLSKPNLSLTSPILHVHLHLLLYKLNLPSHYRIPFYITFVWSLLHLSKPFINLDLLRLYLTKHLITLLRPHLTKHLITLSLSALHLVRHRITLDLSRLSLVKHWITLDLLKLPLAM